MPLPAFSRLADYEWTSGLDVAHVVALILFLASLYFSVQLVRLLLLGEIARPRATGVGRANDERIVLALGVLLLLADGALFDFGTSSRTGGAFDDSVFSFPALLLTAGYCATLFGVACWSVRQEADQP